MKIGPSTKRNCRRPWSSSSNTLVPVMSEGIRSGVNWMRLKSMSRIRASVLTISVLARPGTPTSRQWPRVKIAAKICSITSSLADDHLLQLLLHELPVLAEFLEDVSETTGLGGQRVILRGARFAAPLPVRRVPGLGQTLRARKKCRAVAGQDFTACALARAPSHGARSP